MWIKIQVFLFCALATASVSHAAQDDAKPPAWQVEGFWAALNDENPKVVADTIQNIETTHELFAALGERGKEVMPRWTGFLHDPDWNIRSAVVKALGKLGVKEQAPELAKLLDDPHESVRREAAQALGAMGAKEQAPALVELLGPDESESVRREAAQALGAMGAKEQAPALVELLGDPDESESVRREAAQALGAMGAAAKEQAPELVKLLHDPDVRWAAAQALGAMGAAAKEQAPELVKLLNDPHEHEYVRAAAARAMGAMGAKEQAPALVELLGDPDESESVRREAAQALGAMGAAAKEQAPELVKLLHDPDVRWAAAQALGAMGAAAKEQAPELVKLLHDPDSNVRGVAARALIVIGAVVEEPIPVLAKLLRDSDRDVREVAARAMGAMGAMAQDQIPELVKQLWDPEYIVRFNKAQALAAIRMASNEQAQLDDLLNNPDAWIRLGAAVALIQSVGAAKNVGVAKNQLSQLLPLIGDQDSFNRSVVISGLRSIGAALKDQIPKLAEMLHHPLTNIRLGAISILGTLGAKEQAPELSMLLRDSEPSVRQAAARALGKLGPHDLKTLSTILSIVYDDSCRTGEIRFWAHFLGGGNPNIETLMAWVGEPITRPTAAVAQSHDLAVTALHVFEQAWPLSEPFPKLRRYLEIEIATVAQTGRWKTDDLPLLKTHATNLAAVGSTHAAAVQQIIASVEATDYALTIAKAALGHMLFWLALIAVYPRSRIVQAIFFWNPWMRRFTGLGYVGFALTWVPFLRTKLFAPFKPSLIADAALDTFDETAYFPDSVVREKASGRQRPLREAIPAIRGQIVLEGESGIGKTMFLRSLVKQARRVVVYLPAKKCVGGVLEAIQAKLHGPAQDPAFLRNLIYSGALDICIDGLNEVSADARAKITGFVEGYSTGNILMSTQPLEWTPPATAKSHILEPLTESQIENFLLSRKDSLPDDAQLVGDAYEQTCRHYLTTTLDPQQSPEALAAMRQLLSNPMDLTLVAAMLARGETPDIFHLQEQQYRIMAKDYRRTQLHEFPLPQFAEAVYQMRLQDEDTLPVGEFADELQCMERHKMAVTRLLDEGGKSRTEWHFRHDKIADFFIVQAFRGPANDKPEKHLGDARFRGVYLQLARLLPLDDARALERRLIDYAADTQDHTVSDTFIQLLRSRQDER